MAKKSTTKIIVPSSQGLKTDPIELQVNLHPKCVIHADRECVVSTELLGALDDIGIEYNIVPEVEEVPDSDKERDQLVADLVNLGVNPPDKANKKELRRLLKEAKAKK